MSKEIQQIIKAIDSLPTDTRAVLATVVDLKGSGYRLPGARMLLLENGDTFGTVSGGCLEADVLERARKVLKTGNADVFVYDTTADENSVFSLNMGCRGVMRILLEPVERENVLVKLINRVRQDRDEVTVATYIGGDAGETISIGSRMFVGKDEIPESQSAILQSFPGIDDDLLTFHGSTATYETMRYVNDAGEGEFAFETLRPPVLLAIFGAGADAVPLASVAHDLGWQVNVIDHRPAFLTRERFPDADKIVMVDRETTDPGFAIDRLTAIVSINHNYDRDKRTIRFALGTEAFYIGALGPKKRTEQILEELRHSSKHLSAEALGRLRYPAGLDIGGDTPESIAISIIAEIQSVRSNRTGGSLHDRNGAIYERK